MLYTYYVFQQVTIDFLEQHDFNQQKHEFYAEKKYGYWMNSRIINDNIILVVDVDGTGAGTGPDLEYNN